jgi:hypothetical protein
MREVGMTSEREANNEIRLKVQKLQNNVMLCLFFLFYPIKGHLADAENGSDLGSNKLSL